MEAGLGGRYDATSVVDGGRDGADQRRPRAHALARPDADRHRRGEAGRRARRGRRSCWARSWPRPRWRWPSESPPSAEPGSCGPARWTRQVTLRSRGAFQRRNLALARTAAEAHLNGLGRELDERAVLDAAAGTEVPGRLQLRGGGPAHGARRRPQPRRRRRARGIAARRVRRMSRWRSCWACSRTRTPRRCCGRCCRVSARAWFTAPPSRRALSPAALQSQGAPAGLRRDRLRAPSRASAGGGPGVGARARRRRAGHGLGLPRRRSPRQAGRLR